jgi:hypothetical protein
MISIASLRPEFDLTRNIFGNEKDFSATEKLLPLL